MKTNLYFDLSKFEKVEDIIYFDEPILTHLILNEKDYLLYLVDTTDNSDIFLLFQIDEDVLFEYLTKNKSLRSIIQDANFVNIIEKDFKGDIVNTSIAMPVSLPDEYLPITDSFIEFNPTENSYYYEKINEYKHKLYLLDLRKNSFYLKFSTNNKKYGYTIGFRELTKVMLKNVSQSYKNFVEIDFEKKFGNIIPIDSERSSILRKVIDDTDLRMVDLKYGSFEIGLSVDTLMKTNIDFKEVKEWTDNVGNDFKKIVLDDEIDQNELDELLNKYTEEERNKIFEPIVKIVDNPDYDLKIRNNKEKKYHNLGIKKKDVSSKIITKKKVIQEQVSEKDFELINVTTIRDKNSNKKTINLEHTLFSTVKETEYKLTYQDFQKYGYTNYLDKNIEIKLRIENKVNQIILIADYDNQIIEVNIDNDKIDEGIKKMTDKIYEYIANED